MLQSGYPKPVLITLSTILENSRDSKFVEDALNVWSDSAHPLNLSCKEDNMYDVCKREFHAPVLLLGSCNGPRF